MLAVIEREVNRNIQMKLRLFKNWSRNRAFVKTEAAGIDLTGSWDETLLRKNDVGAYQEASKIHTFVENE